MSFDLNAIIDQAANESEDLSEASKGGGGATPPAAGTCIGTLVGYIELGLRVKKGYKGAADKKVRKARWIIELAGGTNPHTKSEDGTTTFAKRITVHTWLPEKGKKPSDKSGFYKLFSAINHAKDPAIKIPAQCLGKHFKVIVSQEKFTNESGDEIVYGSIGNAQDGFRISPARVDITDPVTDMPTGEFRIINAPEVVSSQRCFLWDYATPQMWDSLFIDGEYEAVEAADGKAARPAKSKNVIQEEIKQALDWKGSKMQSLLGDGGELDTGELEGDSTVSTGGVAGEDALAGLL
jgi:hypothetical protein